MSNAAAPPRKSLEPWLLDSIDFYDHQVKGVRTLTKMTSWLLADEMGLGKSLQALTVFCVDLKLGLSEKMIVVCPVTLKFNWYDEINKFTTIPCTILGIDDPEAEKIKPLSPADRRKQIDKFKAATGPRILIANYEQVTAHVEQLNTIGFDIRCFDEAHYLKNKAAKRTKASMKLRGKRTFLLTGSPMLNQVNELWTLLHMISPRDFPNYWNFVQRYCNTPDAPIWMGDGSFKPIGEIVAGDKVMGWKLVNGRRSREVAIVEEVQERQAPDVIEVTLESGQVIKCTPDHQWLRASHGTGSQDVFSPIVRDSGKGRPLETLSKVLEPTPILTPKQQREVDWLMGIYDGEGNGTFIAQSITHNPEIHNRIGEVLESLGIEYRLTDNGYEMLGGLQTYVNLLNWCPHFVKRRYFTRRILMGNRRGEGVSAQMNRTPDRIVSVRHLGPGKVVSMQTTTGNYVAWGYASKNCVFGGYMNKQIIGVKNQAELVNKLQNYQLRRLKKDVLNLKEPQIIQVKVDLHDQQRILYDQVVNDMQLTLPSEPTPKDIENALTKFLRPKQICGTTATIEGYADHSHKLDRAVEIIVEQLEAGERVVVFTQFRGVLSAIENRLAQAAPNAPFYALHGDVPKERRQAVVSEWGATATPGVIVCMLQVAGIGLNMTQARVAVFLDKLFVPMLNKQAIDRLHRIGASETQPVQIYEMLCRGTIETRIEAILKVKSKLFGSIVEEAKLKRRLVESLLGRASDEDGEEDD